MLKYISNSNRAVIVLHEIYGINEHIKKVCHNLSIHGFDVLCPNLLDDNCAFEYGQEDRAYRNFYEHVGLERAFCQVKDLLEKCRNQYRDVYVIGYSIGATIAWLCSNKHKLCDAVVGFYGSRIRDYLELTPKCPVLLLFPTEEKSFDVDYLIKVLRGRNNVQTEKLSGKHGFADTFSKNYVEESQTLAYSMMFRFLDERR